MHETDYCFYNIESPAPRASVPTGQFQLLGWLVSKPGDHFIDLCVRVGSRRFFGTYGFPRPDLANYFEPVYSALLSGFSIWLDFPPGPVVLSIEALSYSGQWHPLGNVVYQVTAVDLNPPLALPEPLRAHEFARALKLLVKDTGEVHPGSEIPVPWPRVLRDNHPPFHAYLSEPAAMSLSHHGRLPVLGWLFHEQLKINRVFVTTDLLALQPLEIGGSFPNIAARFPQFPQAADSRIFGFADVAAHIKEPATVRIYAELNDRTLHLVLAYRCRPISTPETKATWPSFSLLHFWRQKKALMTALSARGIPLEEGAGMRKAIRELRQEYRHEALSPIPHYTKIKPTKYSGQEFSLLLVTHNLNREGAPLFLLEYTQFLLSTQNARVTLVSPADGPLRTAFVQIGAKVQIGGPEIILALLSDGKFGLLVANTLACHWAITLARARNLPSLFYIHESTPLAAFFKTSPDDLKPAQRAFAQASAVSFLTEASQCYYTAHSQSSNYRIIPGWIDLAQIDDFQSSHLKNNLRAKLGLQPNERLIINIGTVCDRKGQHVFIRAVELLWRQQPQLAASCHFIMVGGRDTPYNHSLQTLLDQIARPNIAIVPETPEVYDFYGAADLFVCTSFEESFPRVILEAMAFSLPIISTDVHGIPEIVRSGEEAILMAPGNPYALSHGITQLLSDLKAAQSLGRQARQRLEDTFTAKKILPHHLALACELAARPQSANSYPLA